MSEIIVSPVPVSLVPPWPRYRNPALYRCEKCGHESVQELTGKTQHATRGEVYAPYMCGRCVGPMFPVIPSWVTVSAVEGAK